MMQKGTKKSKRPAAGPAELTEQQLSQIAAARLEIDRGQVFDGGQTTFGQTTLDNGIAAKNEG